MIICHSHRFIFIKTRKTAGSSVEIALSRNCGPGDILTTLSEKRGEEGLRRQEGGFGPAGWQKRILQHRGLREWRRFVRHGVRAPRFDRHETARDVRRKLGAETWDSYFRFTIERNPWDRAVSRYWWDWGKGRNSDPGKAPPLSDYLHYLASEKPFKLTNWDHYAIDGRIAVDRVLFYESLSEGLARLRSDLDLPHEVALPGARSKSGFRPPASTYRTQLSEADRRLIERVCAREIEAFGYTF